MQNKKTNPGTRFPLLFRLPRIRFCWGGAGGLCLALLGAGCAKQAAPPALPAASVPAHWHIQLTTVPAAPRQLDPTQFQAAVTDGKGRPVSAATVTINLIMPAMDMGQNQSAATAGAAGIYTATGRFTMPGRWQVTVQASKEGKHQARSFPISVQ